MLLDCRAIPSHELAERRDSVPEHPRIAVVVGAEPIVHAERAEQADESLQRSPFAGILVVVRHLGDGGVRLRMLDLEPRHEHPTATIDGEPELVEINGEVV